MTFDELEALGLVRLFMEPDQVPYDDSYIDTWPEEEQTQAREDLWRLIEREGVWVLSAQYRLTRDDPWEIADSIGACVGGDWENYVDDFRRHAVEARATALNSATSEYAEERVTYAS